MINAITRTLRTDDTDFFVVRDSTAIRYEITQELNYFVVSIYRVCNRENHYSCLKLAYIVFFALKAENNCLVYTWRSARSPTCNFFP